MVVVKVVVAVAVVVVVAGALHKYDVVRAVDYGAERFGPTDQNLSIFI